MKRHTSNLLYWSSEPFTGTDDPITDTVGQNNSNSDDGVIQRLRVDGLTVLEIQLTKI